MTATQLIQKYIIEHNLATFVEENPELARFFDPSGSLIDTKHFEEILEIIEDSDTYQDALYEFDAEQGERIDSFGIEEGRWPHYYKAFEIDDKIVAWCHQYGGGKYCEYRTEWLPEAFFVKRRTSKAIVYIYEDLRKND